MLPPPRCWLSCASAAQRAGRAPLLASSRSARRASSSSVSSRHPAAPGDASSGAAAGRRRDEQRRRRRPAAAAVGLQLLERAGLGRQLLLQLLALAPHALHLALLLLDLLLLLLHAPQLRLLVVAPPLLELAVHALEPRPLVAVLRALLLEPRALGAQRRELLALRAQLRLRVVVQRDELRGVGELLLHLLDVAREPGVGRVVADVHHERAAESRGDHGRDADARTSRKIARLANGVHRKI